MFELLKYFYFCIKDIYGIYLLFILGMCLLDLCKVEDVDGILKLGKNLLYILFIYYMEEILFELK